MEIDKRICWHNAPVVVLGIFGEAGMDLSLTFYHFQISSSILMSVFGLMIKR